MIVVYPCNYTGYTTQNPTAINRFTIIFVLLCLARVGFGEELEYKTFARETDISLKSELALELWNFYLSNDLDSLKIIGTELLHDAKEANHDFGEAVAYRIIGDYEVWNGSHMSGREHLKSAARYFLGMENYLLYSECLISLGNSYFMEGDLADARKAYLNALDAGKKSGDQSAWFAPELNLAKVLAARSDTLKALELGMHYKNEALRLSRYEAVSNAYGFLYNMINKDSLLRSEYLQKSIDFARKSKSLNQLSHALNNAAIEHFYAANTDSAEVLFTEALHLRKKANNHRLICESYLNLAQLNLELGNLIRSSAYADSSISHALLTGQNLEAKDALVFKCENLHSLSDCEKLNQLQTEIDSLVQHEAVLLNEILSIYEDGTQGKDEKQGSGILGIVLTSVIVLGLGILIYKD